MPELRDAIKDHNLVILPVFNEMLTEENNQDFISQVSHIFETCKPDKIEFRCYHQENNPVLNNLPPEILDAKILHKFLSSHDLDAYLDEKKIKEDADSLIEKLLGASLENNQQAFIKHCLYWKSQGAKVFILTEYSPFSTTTKKIKEAITKKIDDIIVRRMNMVELEEKSLARLPVKQSIQNVIFTICMHNNNYLEPEEFERKLNILLKNFQGCRITVVIADTLDRYNRKPQDLDGAKVDIMGNSKRNAVIARYLKIFKDAIPDFGHQKHRFMTWNDFIDDPKYAYYLEQYENHLRGPILSDLIEKKASKHSWEKEFLEHVSSAVLKNACKAYLIEEGAVAYMQLCTDWFPGVVIYERDPGKRYQVVEESLQLPIQQISLSHKLINNQNDQQNINEKTLNEDFLNGLEIIRLQFEAIFLPNNEESITNGESINNALIQFNFILAFLSNDYLPSQLFNFGPRKENEIIKKIKPKKRSADDLKNGAWLNASSPKFLLTTSLVIQEKCRTHAQNLLESKEGRENLTALLENVLSYYATIRKSKNQPLIPDDFSHYYDCQNRLIAPLIENITQLLSIKPLSDALNDDKSFQKVLAELHFEMASFYLFSCKFNADAIAEYEEALKFYGHLDKYGYSKEEKKRLEHKAAVVYREYGISLAEIGNNRQRACEQRKALKLLVPLKIIMQIEADDIKDLKKDTIYVYLKNGIWVAEDDQSREIELLKMPEAMEKEEKDLLINLYVLYYTDQIKLYDYGCEEYFELACDLGYNYANMAVFHSRAMSNIAEHLEIAKFYLKLSRLNFEQTKHLKRENEFRYTREPELGLGFVDYRLAVIHSRTTPPDVSRAFDHLTKAECHARQSIIDIEIMTQNSFPDLIFWILEYKIKIALWEEMNFEKAKELIGQILLLREKELPKRKITLLHYECMVLNIRRDYYEKYIEKDLPKVKGKLHDSLAILEKSYCYSRNNSNYHRFDHIYFQSIVYICSFYMTSILTKKESSVVDMHSLDYYLEILSEYNQAVFSIQAQIDLYVALKKMIFDPTHPTIQSNLLNTNILDLHIAYDLYTLGCLYFENTYYQESHGKEQHRWIAYSLFSLLEVFYQTANRTDHFVAKMVTKKISELVSSAEERKPSRRSPICTLFKKETLDTETYPFNSHVSPNFF